MDRSDSTNNLELNGFILIDDMKIKIKENPTMAPISLLIYSVHVLNTLNSSAYFILG